MNAKIEAAIVDIGDRIREERVAGDRFTLGSVSAARHGGVRDGLKEALAIIERQVQRTDGTYPLLSNAYSRILDSVAKAKDDPPATKIAVRMDDLRVVTGHMELLRVALAAWAAGTATITEAATHAFEVEVGIPTAGPAAQADPRFAIAHDSLSNPTLAVIRKYGITDGRCKEAIYHLSHALRISLRKSRPGVHWIRPVCQREAGKFVAVLRAAGLAEWQICSVADDLEGLHRAIVAKERAAT